MPWTFYDKYGQKRAMASPIVVGQEVAYAEFTANVVTAAGEGAAGTVVTAPTFTADGVSAYLVEFFVPWILGSSAGADYELSLFDGATNLGFFGSFHAPFANARVAALRPARKFVFSAGPHALSVRQWSSGATSMTSGAGLGGAANTPVPGFIRVTRIDNVQQALLGGSSLIVMRKTTPKIVNTTVAATDLLNGEITIPAGAMGPSGFLRLTAWGDWLNNTGGGVASPRFQLVFGGTTFLDTGTQVNGFGAGALRSGWGLSALIANAGAANSQTARLHLDLTSQNSATAAGTTDNSFLVGEGVYGLVYTFNGASVTYQGMAEGSNSGLAVDTTTAKNLVLNVINGSASAACEMKLFGALIEIIP